MSEETATTEAATAAETTETEEQRVPYERFQQANKKAKEAADRAKALEKQMSDLQAQIEEREQAGLPELERLKKDMERAQKRAEDAEARAEAQEKAATNAKRERLVLAAASQAGFDEVDDALRYPEHVNLDEIETPADAERAVKRLAKARPKLLKGDDPVLPGRVLRDGQRETTDRKPAGIDPLADAQVLADGLKQFASKQ
jgi:hypothetical protein